MMNVRSALLIAGVLLFLPAAVTAQARVEKNVVVGVVSGLALTMDVHYPEEPNGYGVVHIVGNGWYSPSFYGADLLSDRSRVHEYKISLVDEGYTVFSLNHRAIPRFRFPAPLEDVQRAVRFIRYHAAEYGIDPQRIGALGGSAGGNLALQLGVQDGEGDQNDRDPINRVSAKVQAVVAQAARTDLAQYDLTRGMVTSVLLIGDLPSRNLESEMGRKYWLASPVNHASGDDPPTLLIHGDADEVVPIHHSEIMLAALQEHNVEARLLRIPGGGHGKLFPGATDPPDYIGAMVDWFDRLKR